MKLDDLTLGVLCVCVALVGVAGPVADAITVVTTETGLAKRMEAIRVARAPARVTQPPATVDGGSSSLSHREYLGTQR